MLYDEEEGEVFLGRSVTQHQKCFCTNRDGYR